MFVVLSIIDLTKHWTDNTSKGKERKKRQKKEKQKFVPFGISLLSGVLSLVAFAKLKANQWMLFPATTENINECTQYW